MIRLLSVFGVSLVVAIWSGSPACAQAVVPRGVGQRPVQQQVRREQPQPRQARRPQPTAPPANGQTGGARAPAWIPLPPQHEQRLNQILNFWEFSTGKIQRYRCQFKRWDYEPTLRAYSNGSSLKTYSEGVIKFAAPDKGLFRVEKVQHLRTPANGQPQWVEQADGYREHWVCDGKSIFEFDHQNQQLVQRTLPPDVQGQRITEGPLPFMFGAKANRIKQRFWVRPLWPASAKEEYWLELVPKTRDDAANFRKLKIVIAEQDYLPKGMILYHPNGAQTTFGFESRETNWNIVAQQLRFWEREFYEPRLPDRSWKKVVEPIGSQAVVAPRPASRQAQRRPETIQPR